MTGVRSQAIPLSVISRSDPIAFLLACGFLEDGRRHRSLSAQLWDVIRPLFPKSAVQDVDIPTPQLREPLRRYMEPGETLSQLVVKMRED